MGCLILSAGYLRACTCVYVCMCAFSEFDRTRVFDWPGACGVGSVKGRGLAGFLCLSCTPQGRSVYLYLYL